MGAAIPVALTLALAVPDQLPCASQGVQLQVMTGSTDCFDEIAPTNADGEEDVCFFSSSISCVCVCLWNYWR